jgi:hypothetical protein
VLKKGTAGASTEKQQVQAREQLVLGQESASTGQGTAGAATGNSKYRPCNISCSERKQQAQAREQLVQRQKQQVEAREQWV